MVDRVTPIQLKKPLLTLGVPIDETIYRDFTDSRFLFNHMLLSPADTPQKQGINITRFGGDTVAVIENDNGSKKNIGGEARAGLDDNFEVDLFRFLDGLINGLKRLTHDATAQNFSGLLVHGHRYNARVKDQKVFSELNFSLPSTLKGKIAEWHESEQGLAFFEFFKGDLGLILDHLKSLFHPINTEQGSAVDLERISNLDKSIIGSLEKSSRFIRTLAYMVERYVNLIVSPRVGGDGLRHLIIGVNPKPDAFMENEDGVMESSRNLITQLSAFDERFIVPPPKKS